jgi:hypothetical protein
MRSLYSVALAAVTLALSGCLSDAKDPNAPPPGTGDGVPEIPVASATFRAQFDPLKGIVPYPNDITGWSGSTDGTLNLPPAATALQLAAAEVNQLDGFSIFSRIQANFTRSVAPASLRPDTVFFLEVALDPATKAVVGLADATLCKIRPDLAATCAGLGLPGPTGNPFLVQGVDYAVSVAPDVDAGGQTVQLVPLKPLNPIRNNALTPGSHNGYLMILTSGISDTAGTPAQPDATYAQIRGAYQAGLIPLPPPPGLPADQLLAVFIATHLAWSTDWRPRAPCLRRQRGADGQLHAAGHDDGACRRSRSSRSWAIVRRSSPRRSCQQTRFGAISCRHAGDHRAC